MCILLLAQYPRNYAILLFKIGGRQHSDSDPEQEFEGFWLFTSFARQYSASGARPNP